MKIEEIQLNFKNTSKRCTSRSFLLVSILWYHDVSCYPWLREHGWQVIRERCQFFSLIFSWFPCSYILIRYWITLEQFPSFTDLFFLLFFFATAVATVSCTLRSGMRKNENRPTAGHSKWQRQTKNFPDKSSFMYVHIYLKKQ